MKTFLLVALVRAGTAVAQVMVTAEAAAGKGGFVADEPAPLAASRAPPPPAPPSPVPPPERQPLSAQAADTLRQINAYRAAGATCGTQRFEPAPPLQWHEALERAADAHVRDMAQRNTVAHDGSDGSSVGDRVKRQGYVWGGVGENAAAGRETTSATLAQWMSSPGHCRNMMGAGYRHVAVVGVHRPGSTYRWYWIMVLATPMGG